MRRSLFEDVHEEFRASFQTFLSREVVGEEGLIGGSIGPTGQLVEPYGSLTREMCEAAPAQ